MRNQFLFLLLGAVTNSIYAQEKEVWEDYPTFKGHVKTAREDVYYPLGETALPGEPFDSFTAHCKWTFDEEGKILLEQFYNGNKTLNFERQYQYDSAGYLKQLSWHPTNEYAALIQFKHFGDNDIEALYYTEAGVHDCTGHVIYDSLGRTISTKLEWIYEPHLNIEFIYVFSPDGKQAHAYRVEEGDTVFIELIVYDEQGNRLEYRFPEEDGSWSIFANTYNEHGDWIGEQIYNTNDPNDVISAGFVYEYDSRGNWVKCLFMEGSEIVEVTIREIEYFD